MTQSSPDIESLRIGLDAVASQIRSWLDWNRKHRENNDPPLKTDDGTSIMCLPVPYWPSHGAFENWIKLFEDCRAALSPSSAGSTGLIKDIEYAILCAREDRASSAVEWLASMKRKYSAPAQPSAGMATQQALELADVIAEQTHPQMYDILLSKPEREMIIAALRAGGAAQSAWRPIETAPKDGTEILGWWCRGRTHAIISWSSDGWWMDRADGGMVNTPTNWQPLQDGPSLPSTPRKAPAECPHCHDETDCANVDICVALASPNHETK